MAQWGAIGEARGQVLDALPFRRSTPTQAWVRALGNITPLQRESGQIFPRLVDNLAIEFATKPALQSTRESLSYLQLAERKNQLAHWALEHLPQAGGVVCLLMDNCPDYLAIWLGISQVGGLVALINTNLVGDALVHALSVAAPDHIIAGVEFEPSLIAIRGSLPPKTTCWLYGDGAPSAAGLGMRLDPACYETNRIEESACPLVTPSHAALLIFTSGTTGLPKGATVTHYKILEWGLWFAGMADTGPDDCLYNCLPMYHSTGGVAAIGAVLLKGGSIVLRPRFSARRFWDDIAEGGCTLFLYIGELCRYLANAPPHAMETQHRLRLCFGNGLREDVWTAFAARFNIPQILEFYASTEGNVALYNVDGRPGAIGRVPSFLAHRFPVAIVEYDEATGEPQRDQNGRCIPCQAGEVGEAVGKILQSDGAKHRRFDGYTDRAATERKILRNAFAEGDAWFRTGDLMRQDKAGFFYFVDRIGDTFRWKGENVSTTQVEDVICRCPGIMGAVVYGVPVPGAEGRAGMAAITTCAMFDPATLHALLEAQLPAYARPMFLRICANLETTGTFKPVKADLAREGFDAEAIDDAVYVNDPVTGSFVRLGGRIAGLPSLCAPA